MFYNVFTLNADGVWRSLVARTLGVGEVAGSNPVTPIERVRLWCLQKIRFARKSPLLAAGGFLFISIRSVHTSSESVFLIAKQVQFVI
jgi:hypothetical protein